MKRSLLVLGLAIVTIFTQCDTLKNLPTNTSGGLFSLNGNWQLTTSNDNRALEGTVITVVPGFADATIKTISNNTYCARERDVLWKGIKSLQGGTFSTENLANACQGAPLYKPATITVLTTDEIRLTGHTAASTELIQTWKRVSGGAVNVYLEMC
jgi:hypothetical protein